MNQFDTPYFSSEFILEYSKGGAERMKRVQTYVAFRFLSALVKAEPVLIKGLEEHIGCELTPVCYDEIEAYLMEDLYFTPVFVENSYDALVFYYALQVTKEKDGVAAMYMDKLLSLYAPEALRISYDESSFSLDTAYENELFYWAALYICLTGYEASLEYILPEFARIYWKELQFTCGDMLLYDFLSEYFEQKDVLHCPEFQELNHTLVLATLQSFRTNLESFAMEVLIQLKHPSSQFAGLYQFGAVGCKDLPTLDVAGRRMEKILEYATAYELRNHLYDYHLDEDKTITFGNWKDKLKWHYVQYNNVYNMAFMTYYAANLSMRMVKKQFMENLETVK
ncbi:MAG: hypothetical protein IKU69_04165 [Roseburia sp.]|nr:hypothetical protein [Roseburia sp.]